MSEEIDHDAKTLFEVFARHVGNDAPSEKSVGMNRPKPEGVRKRRAKENTPLTANTRRSLRATSEGKTAQLNIRITPSLKAQISSMAVARSMSIPDLIEQAIMELASDRRPTHSI